MRNGVNLLHGYGHDAPPVVVSWQHHSGEQSPTTAGSSSSEKNRVVQPSPLNVRYKTIAMCFLASHCWRSPTEEPRCNPGDGILADLVESGSSTANSSTQTSSGRFRNRIPL